MLAERRRGRNNKQTWEPMAEAQTENVTSRENPSAERTSSALLMTWMPVIVWVGVLFLLSTSIFSGADTASIIEPVLRWFLPRANPTTIAILHGLVRKCAHFTNYAILFWLMIRGPMTGRPYAALALCVCYAFIDEGHQILVPGRTASLYDVALDSSGALFSRFLSVALTSPIDPLL